MYFFVDIATALGIGAVATQAIKLPGLDWLNKKTAFLLAAFATFVFLMLR